MTRYVNCSQIGDIFITTVSGPLVSKKESIRLNKSSDIAIYGVKREETLPVRIVENSRAGFVNLVAVPADERSISSDEDCTKVSVICLRSRCRNTIDLPSLYIENDIFCSVKCAEQVRCEDAPIMNKQQPLKPGDICSVTVSRIGNPRNALVRINGEEVNIGPVSCNVGTNVVIQLLSSEYAICLDEEHRHFNYREKLDKMVQNATLPKELPTLSSVQSEIGAGNENVISKDYAPIDTEPVSDSNEPKSETDKSDLLPVESKKSQTEEDKEGIIQDNTDTSLESFEDNMIGELSDFRALAEEAATDNPKNDLEATTKNEYQRSEVIRKYAKKRAGGSCELCGTLAPFTSKSGEPYLEVHHVDELSKGGADHPDKVAALCPTCHMEIHYGSNGSALNNKLREKLPN